MAESQQHREFVVNIVEWINAERNPKSNLVILADDGVGRPESKPQKINGYFPDVFAKEPGNANVIIGEAKTANDVEHSHTERQVAAFLSYIGAVGGGTLVVAVPWFRAITARELIDDQLDALAVDSCEIIVLGQAS